MYRDLYYRWEREQWEAGGLELAAGRVQWEELPADLRAQVADLTRRGAAASARAVDSLVERVDAATSEEEQIAWTTRMVDAARHSVFFDLVRTELVGAVAQPAGDEPGPTPEEIERVVERLNREAAAPEGLCSGLGYVLRDRRRHADFPDTG